MEQHPSIPHSPTPPQPPSRRPPPPLEHLPSAHTLGRRWVSGRCRVSVGCRSTDCLALASFRRAASGGVGQQGGHFTGPDRLFFLVHVFVFFSPPSLERRGKKKNTSCGSGGRGGGGCESPHINVYAAGNWQMKLSKQADWIQSIDDVKM